MEHAEVQDAIVRYLAAKSLFFASKIAKKSSSEVWSSIGHRLPADKVVFQAWYDDEHLEFPSIDQFETWARSLESAEKS